MISRPTCPRLEDRSTFLIEFEPVSRPHSSWRLKITQQRQSIISRIKNSLSLYSFQFWQTQSLSLSDGGAEKMAIQQRRLQLLLRSLDFDVYHFIGKKLKFIFFDFQ